ncbi:phosphoenolpyruvate synthase [Vibrio sp. CAIM 722]|uniref:Phosphoenolpyruvate synthase n=1 Tax=Vibrio eleionomae TaxID=2653505 RepID=A0A7X4RUH3_9VIBR|nr:putative PEP-binding protein [Vibrio eleionomae]MZI93280.1 phosphoenolpyruvate synthase [Vibrio eleionomae]
MSFEQSSVIHEQLALGNSLPGADSQGKSPFLFVSLSELIAECVFYHPTLVCGTEGLTELEKNSLDALLNGQSIEEHFVSTLVAQIEHAITADHQTVRVSLSNADSHDFQALIGGSVENSEVNPAIGLRGVSRYASKSYAAGFALECKVIKALRDKGHDIEIVVPFVRTLSNAATVIDRLAEQGLPRGLNGLKVSYVCNVPSSALLAERLLKYFDGVVIDWDLLTQCTLGIDKQNPELEHLYNPESEAVTMLVAEAASAAEKANKPLVIVTTALAQYSKLQAYLIDNHPNTCLFDF